MIPECPVPDVSRATQIAACKTGLGPDPRGYVSGATTALLSCFATFITVSFVSTWRQAQSPELKENMPYCWRFALEVPSIKCCEGTAQVTADQAQAWHLQHDREIG
jgi:hypothetical protein